jgi:hypothetical protein
MSGTITNNRSKTHCPYGHAYTDEDTYRTREGKWQCKACHRERMWRRRRGRSPWGSAQVDAAGRSPQNGRRKGTDGSLRTTPRRTVRPSSTANVALAVERLIKALGTRIGSGDPEELAIFSCRRRTYSAFCSGSTSAKTRSIPSSCASASPLIAQDPPIAVRIVARWPRTWPIKILSVTC